MSGRHSKEDTTQPAEVSTASNVSVVQDPNDSGKVIIRTRKRKRIGKKKASRWHRIPLALRVLIVVLLVVVALAGAAGITLAVAVNRGNVNLHRVFEEQDDSMGKAGASTSEKGQIVEYKGHTYRYNENVVSFVVIGHDDESNAQHDYGDRSLADTIVLFTLDTSTNKVRATVVPRNTWCAVDLFDENGTYVTTNDMQITLSHGVTLPTQDECAANTVKSVSRIFYNMPITYYFDFGREVVSDAATAIGGVPITALETIPGTDYVEGDEVLLEGDAAYRYVAYRDTDKDESALDRQARQAQFIRAFAAKVSGLGARGLLDVYNGVSDEIVTNLGVSEVAYLATCFATGDNAELETVELKGETSVGREADGIEYERYHLDADSVMENTLASYYVQID